MEREPTKPACPFCTGALTHANGRLAYAMLDEFPVTTGHTLVVITRHESSLLKSTSEEWEYAWNLVQVEARRILSMDDFDGVNVGVNIGASAGQTVNHAHIHIIPRVTGDHIDPSGGVRCVLP